MEGALWVPRPKFWWIIGAEGAAYTGLALGNVGGNNYLYAS